ncbi:hypothetical protein HPB50_011478 [Hyalomma asiaticum]|uniref:Uncharacterized protein n=1 Tax=Hyalomma asiaticum TaxID=266040 RepID=A0ACB7SQ62_HYAAI|nr:hypothetical protein HPB50_011478 [Hyalomma asiaticum]
MVAAQQPSRKCISRAPSVVGGVWVRHKASKKAASAALLHSTTSELGPAAGYRASQTAQAEPATVTVEVSPQLEAERLSKGSSTTEVHSSFKTSCPETGENYARYKHRLPPTCEEGRDSVVVCASKKRSGKTHSSCTPSPVGSTSVVKANRGTVPKPSALHECRASTRCRELEPCCAQDSSQGLYPHGSVVQQATVQVRIQKFKQLQKAMVSCKTERCCPAPPPSVTDVALRSQQDSLTRLYSVGGECCGASVSVEAAFYVNGFALSAPYCASYVLRVFTMPTCCVPGCTSGYRKSETARHFFCAPRDTDQRAAWDHAIPRADKKLSNTSRVCDMHFHEKDILKTFTHIINGKKVEITRGKWNLVEGCVPQIFPNLPAYLSKPATRKQKLRDTSGTLSGISSAKKERLSPSTSPEEGEEDKRALFVERCVVVAEDMTITVSGRGRLAKSPDNVDTVAQLAELLENIEKLKVCSGCPNSSAGSLVSNDCEVLTDSPNCGPCSKLWLKLCKQVSLEKLKKKQRADMLKKRATRAAVRRSKLLKNAGPHKVSFDHFRLLYKMEENNQLKVVPKLTASHINPSNLQKMSVQLATQLFSRSVAIGFSIYREQNTPEFENTHGTESFTLLLNNVFDALNARIPAEGIRKDSRQIQVLKDFLNMLNETEQQCRQTNTKMFASQMTVESLRVTLMSVLDIIDIMHSKGVPYVLTAKLNQDPLERFFGVVRTFGGDEDHPTITSFSQVFRLLSLHTPLKMAIRGNNCTGESDPVLISLEKTLNSKKMLALTEKQKRNKQLDSLLKSITLQDHPTSALEHGYNRAGAQDIGEALSERLPTTRFRLLAEACCAASATKPEAAPAPRDGSADAGSFATDLVL